MKQNFLTIAVPKGKLLEEAVNLFQKIGLPTDDLKDNTRKLLLEYPEVSLRYIICRPTDIPTYVEYGASDIGIVGKDIIEEVKRNIIELLDLGFGKCKFVLALPEKVLKNSEYDGDFRRIFSGATHIRVATKFPNVARDYFEKIGFQAEIIHLHGNIELAPQVGLADAIVDIVSTGRTLRENSLIAVDDIFEATARLVANRVSYRLKHEQIQELLEKIHNYYFGG
ncbi:MAG: ATP phosphoribosyltransferase [Clostridia bacterium 41_269]|nr:MAG: ATP phosphoribosyltransferase [Clostridia bacterium 41_269]